MSFGISGDTENNMMVGGDVVVAWVNRLNGKGYAQDYFLEAKSQCSVRQLIALFCYIYSVSFKFRETEEAVQTQGCRIILIRLDC